MRSYEKAKHLEQKEMLEESAKTIGHLQYPSMKGDDADTEIE